MARERGAIANAMEFRDKLMGALSRAVLAGGGHVTGVIPKALLDLGVGEGGVSELIVTDGLRDRKAITHT